MKKLLTVLSLIIGFCSVSHAFTSTIISTSSLQSGATVYVSSGSIRDLNYSVLTSSQGIILSNNGGYIKGTVIQVVIATVTTSSSTATNAFIASNLTASITPRLTTSKIKITAVFTGKLSSGAADAGRFTLYRGTNNLGPAAGMTTLQVGSAVDQLIPMSLVYVDSPATTSATSYTVRFSNVNGVATVGVGSDFSSDQETIVLEEIAQ